MGMRRGSGEHDRGRARRKGVRPTSARVRDSMFNILGHSLQGAAVLDLFAGTGGLGVEALSRGAHRALLIDDDAGLVRRIRETARGMGLESRASARCEDAFAAAARLGRAGESFDLVLLDPPYGKGLLSRAVKAVAEAGILAPGGTIVAEGHWRDRPEVGSGMEIVREARHGETVLWFLRGESRRERKEETRVRIAVYPGSFDPVHHGHIEVVRRAARLFDGVIVAVAENIEKGGGLFSVEERVAMLQEVVTEMPGVEVASFAGLTVDFAVSRGAACLVKGLRAVGDFDYELKQSAMNRRLAPELDTLLFIADPEHAFISSALIREVTRLGGAVDGLVPAAVALRLRTVQRDGA